MLCFFFEGASAGFAFRWILSALGNSPSSLLSRGLALGGARSLNRYVLWSCVYKCSLPLVLSTLPCQVDGAPLFAAVVPRSSNTGAILMILLSSCLVDSSYKDSSSELADDATWMFLGAVVWYLGFVPWDLAASVALEKSLELCLSALAPPTLYSSGTVPGESPSLFSSSFRSDAFVGD